MDYLCVLTLKERIERVLDEKFAGNASEWSRAAGLERVHLGQMFRRKAFERGAVEVDTVQRLAVAARVSPAWLAFGIGGTEDDPSIGTLLLRLQQLPGLQETIATHPERWRVSTVARVVTGADKFASDSRGVPSVGWERALDTTERRDVISTRTADVTAIAKKQVGRRPKMPKGRSE